MNPADDPDPIPDTLPTPDEDEGAPAVADPTGMGGAIGAAADAGAGALDAASGAAELAGGALEGAGGCLEGCAGCSLAVLLTLFATAGTAMAIFR